MGLVTPRFGQHELEAGLVLDKAASKRTSRINSVRVESPPCFRDHPGFAKDCDEAYQSRTTYPPPRARVSDYLALDVIFAHAHTVYCPPGGPRSFHRIC